MKIRHVVIMVLMFRIKDYIEIAGIQGGLLHPADLNPGTLQMETVQRRTQHILIRPKIQKGSYRHITADPGRRIKNQYLFFHKTPFRRQLTAQ